MGTPLDLEEQLTHPRSPLRSVLFDTLLSARASHSTFILNQHDENGTLLGLAQVRARPRRPERDVVFMSPSLDSGSGSHAVWQRLLNHLCIQTAERGGLRVYARLPLQSEELQLFKTVGFLEYGQEEIYKLEPIIHRSAIKSTLQLRPQLPSDSWGLQRLYASLTPRTVQNAEGLAQGQWALTHRRWDEHGRRQGYVWEDGGEILGALHVRNGTQGYWIRTLLHPDALGNAQDLCQAALTLTVNKPHLPVYFAFRQYEAGWQHILPTLEFAPLTSQVLVVKSMAIRVREQTSNLMHAALEASSTEGAAPTVLSHIDTSPAENHNGHHKRHQPNNSILFTL